MKKSVCSDTESISELSRIQKMIQYLKLNWKNDRNAGGAKNKILIEANFSERQISIISC